MARRAKSNHRKQAKNVGEVRIIGGDWRGRKLPVLNAEGLRPTSDRVRETLFNWLQFDIAGADCLDVFSGSGALGFEAASRGAKQVVMLELNSDNARSLSSNRQLLKADNLSVHQVDSLSWLTQAPERAFDVVFVDPPFHQDFVTPTLTLLFSNGYLAEHSLLYLEQEKAAEWPALPEGWRCYREKQTAQVKYGLFCFSGDEKQ